MKLISRKLKIIFIICLLGVFQNLAAGGKVAFVKTGSILLFEALSQTKTMRANFKQQQISNSGKSLTFTGTLVFRRPDRLKWEVKKPYAQLQLVRGEQFLVYDPDLEQVVTQNLEKTFKTTPAGLLFASGPEAEGFFKNKFEIFEAPSTDSLKWVLALPKKKGDLGGGALEIGLDEKAQIKKIITTDIFGKSSTITFSDVSINSQVKDSAFIPIIPEGVEYIEN